MNCRHYAPGQHNACAETEAEMVEEKHRRNFCEYFEFTEAAWDSGATQARRADEAREKLAGLFGESGGTAKASDEARHKLENLFGKDKRTHPDDKQKKARKELDRLFGGKSDSDND